MVWSAPGYTSMGWQCTSCFFEEPVSSKGNSFGYLGDDWILHIKALVCRVPRLPRYVVMKKKHSNMAAVRRIFGLLRDHCYGKKHAWRYSGCMKNTWTTGTSFLSTTRYCSVIGTEISVSRIWRITVRLMWIITNEKSSPIITEISDVEVKFWGPSIRQWPISHVLASKASPRVLRLEAVSLVGNLVWSFYLIERLRCTSCRGETAKTVGVELPQAWWKRFRRIQSSEDMSRPVGDPGEREKTDSGESQQRAMSWCVHVG